MILITRLDGSSLHINAELIETIESTPDTLLTLTTGKKLLVTEKPSTVIKRIINYRRRISVHRPGSTMREV